MIVYYVYIFLFLDNLSFCIRVLIGNRLIVNRFIVVIIIDGLDGVL